MQNRNQPFEIQKNRKASAYTLLVCVILVLLLVLITWPIPFNPPPVIDEGIEVNLGNSDQGLGADQPYLPGQPTTEDHQKYIPPKPAIVEKAAQKEVETNDKEEDAPVVKKPAVTKPNATKIPDKEMVKTRPAHTPPKVVENPQPVHQKPKAVFNGVNGTGTGGNDADSYKPGGNQGVAGGHGDQGRPGGDPSSTNYTGDKRGNSGVSISRGLQGRKWLSLPSFTDDFTDNAKVAVDITVSSSGAVEAAVYQPRGSTTSDPSMKEIALRKARQIKWNATGEESTGTIIFNFRIRN